MEPTENKIDETPVNEPDTLVARLNQLKANGYTFDFNLTAQALEVMHEDGKKITLSPSEFKIVNFYRFEGMSNPSDSSILYVIESESGLKGTMLSSYGVYADALSNEMIKKLDTRDSFLKK